MNHPIVSTWAHESCIRNIDTIVYSESLEEIEYSYSALRTHIDTLVNENRSRVYKQEDTQ